MSASVETACLAEPLPAGDWELLHAIPLNAVAPRRLPDGTEPISALCEGITGTSERIRRTAWKTAEQATWSPGMTLSSLRRIAMASVITSHNCKTVLDALASRAAQPEFPDISGELSATADAALRARIGWFQVVQAVGQIATDTRGYQSRTAIESSDLALWTGRLAHTDPQWTLADGAASSNRAADQLAATPDDVPAVVAAVHQACETLSTLAQAEQEQIRRADRAGRILVPTLSMPESFDIPYAFTAAPSERVSELLSAYGPAGEASREAAVAAGRAALAVNAPSWPLARARAAEHPDLEAGKAPEPAEEDAEPAGRPGLVERTLLNLGVTRPDLLRRGAELDRSSQRLIITAVADPQRLDRSASAWEARRPPGIDALINSVVASGNPRAAALFRHPSQAQGHGPEAEA